MADQRDMADQIEIFPRGHSSGGRTPKRRGIGSTATMCRTTRPPAKAAFKADGLGATEIAKRPKMGANDKTLVEMKLAKNTDLERNLLKQLPTYQAASDAESGIKVIIFFSAAEQTRVEGILDKLGLLGHRDIVLIDIAF
jgi:hypothetical protein